jgi:hypothetical protein
MYTRERGELAKLRTYHQELTGMYHAAVQHSNWARAKRLYSLRQRVQSAIRQREEWSGR